MKAEARKAWAKYIGDTGSEPMVKITMYIPKSTRDRLAERAGDVKMSAAAITRLAVNRYLDEIAGQDD